MYPCSLRLLTLQADAVTVRKHEQSQIAYHRALMEVHLEPYLMYLQTQLTRGEAELVSLEHRQNQKRVCQTIDSLLACLNDMDVEELLLKTPQCCNTGCFDWQIPVNHIDGMVNSNNALRSCLFYTNQGGVCCRLLMWCAPANRVLIAVEVVEGDYDAVVFRRGSVALTFNLKLHCPTANHQVCTRGIQLKETYQQPPQYRPSVFTDVSILDEVCRIGGGIVNVVCSWDPHMLEE